MKILLDEGVPHQLRRLLQDAKSDNVVTTAQFVGLTGSAPDFSGLNSTQKDAKLLREAKALGFDVVVTADKSMQAEQNSQTPVHVVVLDTGKRNQFKLENIRPMLPALNDALAATATSIEQGREPFFSTVQAPRLNSTLDTILAARRPPPDQSAAPWEPPPTPMADRLQALQKPRVAPQNDPAGPPQPEHSPATSNTPKPGSSPSPG